jgi:glycosyltransferase involved in cell wall biosynthesis
VPEIDWHFFNDAPRNELERRAPRALVRLRACTEAVLAAKRLDACAIFAHGHEYATPCLAELEALRCDVPVVVVAYNYVRLPTGVRLKLARRLLPRAARLFIASEMERDLYSQAFGIDKRRLEMERWSLDRVEEAPGEPLEPGRYVCSIGGNARDYDTLLAAARLLPDIPFVIVARPGNLGQAVLPANVRVRYNLPFDQAMNVLAHSAFMALPLLGSEVPCGHVTLVAAMHRAKPFIVTDSRGVADYVNGEQHSLSVPPGDAAALAAAIERLWSDPELCARMAERALAFARSYCSTENAIAQLRRLLGEFGAL